MLGSTLTGEIMVRRILVLAVLVNFAIFLSGCAQSGGTDVSVPITQTSTVSNCQASYTEDLLEECTVRFLDNPSSAGKLGIVPCYANVHCYLVNGNTYVSMLWAYTSSCVPHFVVTKTNGWVKEVKGCGRIQ